MRPIFLRRILTEEPYATLLANRPLEMSGLRVQEPLDLSDAHVPSSLSIESSQFDTTVTLRNTDVDGDLSLTGSTMDGGADFVGTSVSGALYVDKTVVTGALQLRRSRIGGPLIATAARITGILDMSGAETGGSVFLDDTDDFVAAELVEIDASSAKVGGDVIISGVTGLVRVDLTSADIEDQVVVDRASIAEELNMDGVRVGRVRLGSGAELDEVRMKQARVAGDVFLYSARLDDVLCSLAVIGGDLVLESDTGPVVWGTYSSLDLRGAAVNGAIRDGSGDDMSAWPAEGGLDLDGFQFRRGAVSAEATSEGFVARTEDWYKGWLRLDGSYSPQPYRELEAALRSAGQASTADAIAIERRGRERDQQPVWEQPVGYLHEATVGYGYEPERAFAWAAIFLLAGAGFASRVPDRRPDAPSRIILSAQRLIPVISFGEGYAKTDVSSRRVPRWTRRYFYLHAVVGYVLAGFLLTALAQVTTTA